MSPNLFGEVVEIVLGTASCSAAPLRLLEVHVIADYSPFQSVRRGGFSSGEMEPQFRFLRNLARTGSKEWRTPLTVQAGIDFAHHTVGAEPAAE